MSRRPRALPRRPAQVTALGSVLGLILALFWLGLAPAAAQAHAYVISTSPSNGSQIAARPTAVRVSFDEGVTLPNQSHAATIVDGDGTRVDDGSFTLSADRKTLTIGVEPTLPKGAYIASWSVISADSHPVGGSLQFGYGVPASAVTAPPPPRPSTVLSLVVGVVKGLLYLGLVLAFGVLPAALLLGAGADERRRIARVAWFGVALSIAASAGELVAQYFWVASAGPAVAPGALWHSFLLYASASYGPPVVLRAAALVAASLVLIGWAGRSAPPEGLAGVSAILGSPVSPGRIWLDRARLAVFIALGLLSVATIVVNGHGGAGPWWQFLSTQAHASAAIAWIGGLTVLGWLLLRHQLTAERLRRMPWWSLYAGVSVAVLAASGIVQGLVEIVYPGALLTTSYGVMLLVKLALVATALSLGSAGFSWTRRQLRASPDGRPAPGQTARLRGRVRWEAGIAAVVVIISGLLSSITPAKDDYAPTASEQTAIGPYRVTVEVGPARRGPQSFRVTVLQPTAQSALPQSIRVLLNEDGGPVKNLAVEFPYRIPGAISPGKPTPITFASSAVTVPVTGKWTADVTVVASRLEQYTAAVAYDVH